MNDDQPFVHLASGPMAATSVRRCLEQLKRVEEVVQPADDCLQAGALYDVDSNASCRVEWWKRVGHDRDVTELADRETWARVRDDARCVVLWDGPNIVDRLNALRACWWLRDAPHRVHEIVLPPNRAHGLPAFYGSVALKAAEAAPLWRELTLVRDVAARARQWELVRSSSRDLRVLQGDRIVECPATAHDDAFISGCRSGWVTAKHVIGHLLALNPLPWSFIEWRVNELIKLEAIEGRGAIVDGIPEQLRARRSR